MNGMVTWNMLNMTYKTMSADITYSLWAVRRNGSITFYQNKCLYVQKLIHTFCKQIFKWKSAIVYFSYFRCLLWHCSKAVHILFLWLLHMSHFSHTTCITALIWLLLVYFIRVHWTGWQMKMLQTWEKSTTLCSKDWRGDGDCGDTLEHSYAVTM